MASPIVAAKECPSVSLEPLLGLGDNMTRFYGTAGAKPPFIGLRAFENRDRDYFLDARRSSTCSSPKSSRIDW
jgi:hypothetical protein